MTHILKAYSRRRGWQHGKYGRQEQATKRLAEERADETTRPSFRIAEACHADFYRDCMEVAIGRK